ncbi:MAG: glycosyltransferase [Chlorobi bacterium]|nr:glycosyltransferase [Chlorobiota bacterium]
MIYATLLLFIFLLIFYLRFLSGVYSGLRSLLPAEIKSINEFVTIVVPFRNEAENIVTCYKSLTAQNYDKEKYEIIFVNDFSEDNSLEVLLKANDASNVKIISREDDKTKRGHKKKAVEAGISAARGEIIVLTDADCVHGKDWLRHLLSNFDDKTAFVSGPVEIDSGGTLFGKLQKLEFAGLVLTGAGLIGKGAPAICNAANLAFKKSVFFEVGGYEGLMNLSSGDDELLMQKIASQGKYEIRFSADKESIVKTDAKKNLSDFLEQRKRWASKGLFYKNKKLVFELILIFLFYAGLLFQLIYGIFFENIFLVSFILSFLMKIIFEYKILSYGGKTLFPSLPLRLLLIAEIVQPIYIVVSSVSGLFGNYAWKNRKVAR